MRFQFTIVAIRFPCCRETLKNCIFLIVILMACTFEQVFTLQQQQQQEQQRHNYNSNNNIKSNSNTHNNNNNNHQHHHNSNHNKKVMAQTTNANIEELKAATTIIATPSETTTISTTPAARKNLMKDYLTKANSPTEETQNDMLLLLLTSASAYAVTSKATTNTTILNADASALISSASALSSPAFSNFVLSSTNVNTNDSNEIDTSLDYVMTKHIASHGKMINFNKTQDLSSLSLLRLNETTAIALKHSHSEQRRNIANSNGNSNSNNNNNSNSSSSQDNSDNGASGTATNADSDISRKSVDSIKVATIATYQQQLQPQHHHQHQHISNASAAALTALNSSSTASGTTIATAAGSKSNIRTSVKKFETKYVLPKPQKTDAPMLNYIFDTFSTNKHHHHDQRYGPHFEDVQRVGQPTNMTVQAGSSIHLNCRISLLQDKTVSWVRRNAQGENALDLLTVGLHTYTGDKRYKMEFQYPNNWRLKIINVKKDDEAMYECQISTHPPRVIQINLLVNAPKVMIVDEFGDPLQEKYYEIDSTLQLSCIVRNVAMTTSVVYWKHSEDVLNYDVTRGGVSVKTELMDDGANSTLSIAKINKADSGNYTCSISDFQNFSIVVHILNGESFAELHHGGAAGVIVAYHTVYHTLTINLILFLLALCLPAYIHR